MKKLILNIVAAALTVCGLASVSALSPAVYADGEGGNYYCVTLNNGAGGFVSDISQCPGVGDNNLNDNNLMSTLNTVINVIIGIVGLVAVVMMIIGGISFITSQGDSAKVTKARNTILYGVVGLVVALLAFAIVNFVLSSVFNVAG